jgi:hypothetical protein
MARCLKVYNRLASLNPAVPLAKLPSEISHHAQNDGLAQQDISSNHWQTIITHQKCIGPLARLQGSARERNQAERDEASARDAGNGVWIIGGCVGFAVGDDFDLMPAAHEFGQETVEESWRPARLGMECAGDDANADCRL